MDHTNLVVINKAGECLNAILLSLIISCFFYLFACAFGKDYNSYINYFECLSQNTCEEEWEVEGTAVLLAKSIGLIFGADMLFFLYILFAVSTKIYTMSKLRNYKWVAIFYFSTYGFLLEGNQIRAAAALGFALMSIGLYLEGRKKTALLTFSTAVSFHVSALAILLDGFPRKIGVLLCIVSLVILTGLDVEGIKNVSSNYPELASILRLQSFASYLNEQDPHSILNSKLALAILLSVLCFFDVGEQSFKKFNQRNMVFVWGSIYGLSLFPGIFSRISDIFLIIGIVFLVGRVNLNIRLVPLVIAVWAILFYSSVGLIIN